MPLVTGVVVLVFGGLTLWLKDDTFIKMKPTITNLLFSGTLLGGLLFGQSLLRYVFGDVYKLQPKGWMVLTVRWGLFFLVLRHPQRGGLAQFLRPICGCRSRSGGSCR